MKNRSLLVALAAAAFLAGTALVVPIQEAAAKGADARATTSGASTPGAKVNGVRGTTTGTNGRPCQGVCRCHGSSCQPH
jgi:hypothetical protein